MRRLFQRYCESRVAEKGLSATEFALIVPMMMTLVMGILALAMMFFGAFATEVGAAQGARRAGISGSAGAGQDEAARIMSVIAPSDEAAGAVAIGDAPGCQRAVLARLSSGAWVRVPLIQLIFQLRAGSQARVWRFWAGEPSDGCE